MAAPNHGRVTAHLHSILSPGPRSTDRFLPTHTAHVHLLVECIQNTEERTRSCGCTDYPLKKKGLHGTSPQRKILDKQAEREGHNSHWWEEHTWPINMCARVHSIHNLCQTHGFVTSLEKDPVWLDGATRELLSHHSHPASVLKIPQN